MRLSLAVALLAPAGAGADTPAPTDAPTLVPTMEPTLATPDPTPNPTIDDATPAPTADLGCVAGGFSFEFEGDCTNATVLAAYAEQIFNYEGNAGADCELDAAGDLGAKLAAAGATIEWLCDDVYAGQDQVPFTDTAKRGPDLSKFIKQFYTGRTDWQDEVETVYESPDGSATSDLSEDAQQIDSFHDGIAQGRRVAWPGSLSNFQSSVTDDYGEPTCETGAAMCVWPKDRQANDNNGNCATAYDTNCVDKDVADNTNLCYADPDRETMGDAGDGDGLFVFPGDNDNGEGAIHCHGLAWSNDVRDHTYRYRANNLFFVSMYDHLYQRGYVKAIPGAPMCGCVEQMPTVSRCDCTQVDLTETVKITYDPDADAPFQTELTHVHVDFNACQGINNRNNDLWAYIAKLYYQGDVTNRQFGQAGRIITDNGCDEATSYKLLAKGLTTGYDHDVSKWTYVAGRDRMFLHDHYGQQAFARVLRPDGDHYGIIFRVCADCDVDYKKIFYRRRTPVPAGFDLLDNILYRDNDGGGNNKWNEDFSLHSTLDDALADANPWLCQSSGFDYSYNFYGRCYPSGGNSNRNQRSRFDRSWDKKLVGYYAYGAETFEEVPTTAMVKYDWGRGRGMAVRDPADGTIYMTGAGYDIWGNKDDGSFLSETYPSEDLNFIVHAGSFVGTSTNYHDKWSKAGIMLRAGKANNAAHYSVMLTGTNGVCYFTRTSNGGYSSSSCASGSGGASAAWLKIEKRGSTYTSFMGASATYTGSYVGCFQDDSDKDFKEGPNSYHHDVPACNAACAEYRYFALQNGGHCRCDNTYSTPAETYPAIDNANCEGGGHGPGTCGGYACGGPSANAVYTVVPSNDIPLDEVEWTEINTRSVPNVGAAGELEGGLAVTSKDYHINEIIFQHYNAEVFYHPSTGPSTSPTYAPTVTRPPSSAPTTSSNPTIFSTEQPTVGYQSNCQDVNNNWSCCASWKKCRKGEGDCDSDNDCEGSLVCANDNCIPEFGWQGVSSYFDCCTDPS